MWIHSKEGVMWHWIRATRGRNRTKEGVEGMEWKEKRSYLGYYQCCVWRILTSDKSLSLFPPLLPSSCSFALWLLLETYRVVLSLLCFYLHVRTSYWKILCECSNVLIKFPCVHPETSSFCSKKNFCIYHHLLC